MSPVSLASVMTLVLAVVADVWLSRRHETVRAAGRRISRLRPLRWLSTEANQLGYPARLARRLAVEQAVAVVLVAGFLVLCALAVLFTHLLDSVLDGDGVAHLDQPASRWLAAHRDGWLTVVLRAVTGLGAPPALAALAAAVCVGVACTARSWLPIVLGVIGAGGIGLVIVVVKSLVGRPRPPSSFAVFAQQGYSFPSGHAAGTSAVALLSAWLLTHWAVRSWALRVTTWTVALMLAGAVGFSRVYLGVHYISDVLAGSVLGAVWAGTLALAGMWWVGAARTRAAP
jgi:membrane-associated phospholipid phosphatase